MSKTDKHPSLLLTEHLILVIIWLFIFAAPAFFIDNNETLVWQKINESWRRLIPFFVLSLFNHFLLVPFILFKRKKWLYFITGFICIFAFTLMTNAFKNRNDGKAPAHHQAMQQPPKGERMPPHPRHQPPGKRPGALPPQVNTFLIAILILGFDTGLRTAFRWTRFEKEREVLEKEKVKSELAFLRNQISPHFFMNTLNNIHSLIDFDTEEAKGSIIRLSKLMRHLLYDSDADKIHISKEIEFIGNYIDLMKLRYSDKIKVQLHVDLNVPDVLIPPMLFTSYVENTFKHGISYRKESFILVNIHFIDDHLLFSVRNSNHKKQTDKGPSGIGTVNSQKRLDILYGRTYQLEIEDNEHDYFVKLTLPL